MYKVKIWKWQNRWFCFDPITHTTYVCLSWDSALKNMLKVLKNRNASSSERP